MSPLFRNGMMIGCVLFFSACSTRQLTAVLDDIARDTYEKNAGKQRMENITDPTYVPPPTYDQYQKDRQKISPSP